MKVLLPHLLRPVLVAAISGGLVLAVGGCNGCSSNSSVANTPAAADNGQDPALANMDDSYNAPSGQTTSGQPTAVLGTSASYPDQQTSESYSNGVPPDADYDDQSYGAPVYSDQAPPPLPEYDQPPAPADGYLWTPGYWAWGPGGYYWVPGAWVAPPYYGALWTPPYWGWYNGHYYFHHGYWGPHVGFYGGIDYGFGYIGIGFWGGYWSGNNFYYNRAVSNVGGGIRDTYSRNVVYNNTHYGAQPSNRTSYNGHGGINRAPQASEVAAMHEQHEAPLAAQTQAHRAAITNHAQSFSANHGRPAELTASHAVGTTGSIRATPADVHPGRAGMNGRAPENRPAENHATENRPGAPATNNAGRAEQGAAHNQPGVQNRGVENRGVQNHAAPVNRPAAQNHTEQRTNPAANQHNRPATITRQQPQAQHTPQSRVSPQTRQAPQARQMHQAPQARQQAQRPAPQAHRAARPAPQQRQQASRPAPHAAPASHPAPAAHNEAPHGNDDHHR